MNAIAYELNFTEQEKEKLQDLRTSLKVLRKSIAMRLIDCQDIDVSKYKDQSQRREHRKEQWSTIFELVHQIRNLEDQIDEIFYSKEKK
jgi:Zn-dependent peptidase ImmA (M78 family)